MYTDVYWKDEDIQQIYLAKNVNYFSFNIYNTIKYSKEIKLKSFVVGELVVISLVYLQTVL